MIEPQFRGLQWSGDLQEKGAGGFGHEMIEDTVDAIEWALRQNDVRIDPENIFLYGASYGGYQTLMLTCQWQEFVPQNSSLKGFKGAISVSPPSVLRCFLKYTLRK